METGRSPAQARTSPPWSASNEPHRFADRVRRYPYWRLERSPQTGLTIAQCCLGPLRSVISSEKITIPPISPALFRQGRIPSAPNGWSRRTFQAAIPLHDLAAQSARCASFQISGSPDGRRRATRDQAAIAWNIIGSPAPAHADVAHFAIKHRQRRGCVFDEKATTVPRCCEGPPPPAYAR